MHKNIAKLIAGFFAMAILAHLNIYEAKAQVISYESSDFWAGARGLQVQGDYAYCAFQNGLMVFDVTQPDTLIPVSQLYVQPMAYEARGEDVRISGSYAYLCFGFDGIKVIDISNPSNPILVAACPTPGYAFRSAISGHYLLVADGTRGLQVIYIGNPLNPQIVASRIPPGQTLDIFVSGNYAYLTDASYGLVIFNITDPGNPIMISNYPGVGRVYVRGDYAYAGNGSRLIIINISNPASPFAAGQCDLNSAVQTLIVSGNYAFIAARWWLEIVDISNPAAPAKVASMDSVYTYAANLWLDGQHLYVADVLMSVTAVNVSDPIHPSVEASFAAPSTIDKLIVSGDHLFIFQFDGTVKIADISDSGIPDIIASVDIPGTPKDISVSGNYLYCLEWNPTQMLIYDISTIEDPQLAGSWASEQNWGSIFVEDTHAYWFEGTSPNARIIRIDVSDPADPVMEGTYFSPVGSIREGLVRNDTVYMICGNSSLHIVDFTDPQNPTFLGSLAFPCAPYSIDIRGDYCFLVGLGVEEGNFYITNIANPTSPFVTAYIYMGPPSWITDVSLYGDNAFITCMERGVFWVDVSDETNPALIASLNTPEYPMGVAATSDHVYIADETSLISAWYDYDVTPLPCSGYVVGDANGNGALNGLDVTFSVAYFKGGPPPPYSCECTPGNTWFVAGDVNASCSFNGLDVTYMVAYFKGGPALIPCPDCPPE